MSLFPGPVLGRRKLGFKMINSRRSALVALGIVCLFFILARSHGPSQQAPNFEDKLAVNERNHVDRNSLPVGAKSAVDTTPRRENNEEEQRAQEPTLRSQGKSRPAPQKPLADTSHMTTSEKLEYAYPYDVSMRFPNYIWQTWKYSPEDERFQFNEFEESWTNQNPGFIHEILLDNTAWTLIKMLYAAVPEVLEVYESLPLPVLKADFFRYLIIHARGGVYSDIDTFNVQAIVNWIPEDVPKDTIGLVIGIEADPDRPDWAEWYSRRIQFCQWTIQGKPGHPVLREIIVRIIEATMKLKREGKLATFEGKYVVDLTGPAIWTDTIMDYFNDERYFKTEESGSVVDYRNFTGMETRKRLGDVVILPITSFSPGVGQMGSKEWDDPMAFVQHGFEGSWKPEEERHIGNEIVV